MRKTILVLSTITALSTGSIFVPSTMAMASTSTSIAYPGHLIQTGSRGTYVKEIQERLNKLGYSAGTADGIFGPKTLSAVKTFQRAHHLAIDGIVGPQTWDALFSSTGASFSTHPANSTKSTVKLSWEQQNSIVFDSAFKDYLEDRHDTVSVAVYDANTGQTYTYNPNSTYCTASIVKVALMTVLLYKDQIAHRGVTAAQKKLLTPMIEESDNSMASKLWNQLGRGKGITPYLRKFGMNHTTMRNDSYWGLTETNVLDQVTLLKLLAYPNSIIDNTNRQYALGLMEHVVSGQRWGVSEGVPSGTTIALNNGWSPYVAGNWRINSIGYIHGHGHNYVIAVLTFHNASEDYGIDTVEGISRILWNTIGEVDEEVGHETN
ncbi:peptidoglycan-binding protein [Alicyclobacillus shizuokensis]|uniref:peptidoglycan-binding protein n=1 Tax=Alicyclobacillus shizuokensis TaxID=392014 RepID=UPI0008346F90|nr:peptidoglycan-binding protein [Alicyclobacillus shizuokensis]